jgi:1,4-dihydroxy-2-naphthoyl-CoA synthase
VLSGTVKKNESVNAGPDRFKKEGLHMSDTTTTKQILLARRSPAYWRVMFDHPPLNIFGPETIPELNEIITALETDKQVKVVVLDIAARSRARKAINNSGNR